MNDYINRENAIGAILDKYVDYAGLVDSIESVPSADVVEVKHGKWKDTNLKNGDLGWRCSICGYGVFQWNATPYCPNCGAKMDGEK